MLSGFVFSTVLVDDLAPFGSRTSVGILRTKRGSRLYTGQAPGLGIYSLS